MPNIRAMRKFFRWLAGIPAITSPPNATEPPRDWVRDLFERVSILEGDAAGMKIAVESLAESLHKQTAKWNTRSRKEAERAEIPEVVDIDPRIAALRRDRGLQ